MDLLTETIYIIGFMIFGGMAIIFICIVFWATIDNIRLRKQNKIDAYNIELKYKMAEFKEANKK